jgi:hypothetical protein
MLSLHTAVKTGTALLLTSFMLATLSGCSDAGGPVFAEGSESPLPVVAATGKAPHDNTDVYKGSDAEKPAKIAMVVEDYYRNVTSYEVRTNDKKNQSLPDADQAREQAKTFAEAKTYVYKGSLTDAALYDFFRSSVPSNLPAAGTDSYTYEILIDKSKVKAGENDATVSFEDSYSVLSKNPLKIAKGELKDIKMIQINGEWLIDAPSTIRGSAPVK